jgi:L-lactate dehydrogenase complex protein LldG
MTGDRRAFIARVTRSLDRQRVQAPGSPPPVIDDATVRVCGPRESIVAIFKERAVRTGMHVHSATYATLTNVIAELVRTLGIRTVVVGEPLKAFELERACTAGGAKMLPGVVEGARSPFEPLYDIDAGITNVQAAIAETGTLVCTSGEGLPRGLSLVPPIHIAIVFETDIVPDLIDFLPRMSGPLPTNVVLITGPSKTADIEGVLITGVHGPRSVEVVVVGR